MAAGRHDCSICMDSFKNPKLISCHHSFCCKCLEDYVRVNLRNGRFNCPICRASVELPEGGVSALQSNFYIDTDAGDKFPCDICGPKNVACSRCLDCEENLCQSCCYVHEKSKGTRHHKICDLGTLDSETKGKIRQRIFCDQHPEDEIRLFCRDCQALICFMCKVVKHEIHATTPVSDAAAEMKKTLETKVNECSDKLRRVEASKKKGEELDKIITEAEQEELIAVDEQGSQLCKAIVQELEKVKTRIKNVYHNLRQRNAVFTRDVEEEFKTCSTARDNAQTLTSQGTDIDIIKKGPDVKQLISAAISKTEQTSDMRLQNKLFSPVEIKHGDLISLLGTMEDSTEEEGKKKEREEKKKQEIEEKEKHERDERERKEKEEKQRQEWSNGMEARVKALEIELSNTSKQYEETKADAITKGLKLTQSENEIQALRTQHADCAVKSNGMEARVKALEGELYNTRKQYEVERVKNEEREKKEREEREKKEREEREKKEREGKKKKKKTSQVSRFIDLVSTSSSPFSVERWNRGGRGGLLEKPTTSSLPSYGPFGKPASAFSQLSSTINEQQSLYGQQSNFIQSSVGQSTYGSTSVQASNTSYTYAGPFAVRASDFLGQGSSIGEASLSLQGPNTGLLESGSTGFVSPFGSQQTQNSVESGGSLFGKPITMPSNSQFLNQRQASSNTAGFGIQGTQGGDQKSSMYTPVDKLQRMNINNN